MISDTLSEAVESIDGYLNDERFNDTYQGAMRERIVAMRNEMRAVQRELDAPPRLQEYTPDIRDHVEAGYLIAYKVLGS